MSFDTACLVFDDPLSISIPDRVVESEERWVTLGMVGGITILIVAHTYLSWDNVEIIRIISARKATKHEWRQYEKGD